MFFKIKPIIIWMIVLMSMPVHSTIISNLNLIFETFNPISMVQFYEFNDKGYNITDGCIQDMFLYLDGLHRDIFWAVKRTYNLMNHFLFTKHSKNRALRCKVIHTFKCCMRIYYITLPLVK